MSGWWLNPTPLKKMSWDDYSQDEDKTQTSNQSFCVFFFEMCIDVWEKCWRTSPCFTSFDLAISCLIFCVFMVGNMSFCEP